MEDLYINDYLKTLDDWANVARTAWRVSSPTATRSTRARRPRTTGIAETEHLEPPGQDEAQQFKVVASGTYQDAQPALPLRRVLRGRRRRRGPTRSGSTDRAAGRQPGRDRANAAVGVRRRGRRRDSQIIYHGWPYTIGAAGSSALWPGNTYGGDTSYAAGNGPNQPQFADDRSNNINVARHEVVLREGQPAFDVAVFHEDFGLTGQGQDNLTNGWNMGTVTAASTADSADVRRSCCAARRRWRRRGTCTGTSARRSSATRPRRSAPIPAIGRAGNVLFPGHGDYRSLLIYDQSVMPVDVAEKIAALAGQGLPIVIIGQVPNAAPNASGGTTGAAMSAADAQVQAAMAKVTASPHTKVVDRLDRGTLAVLRRQRARRPEVPRGRRVDADEHRRLLSAARPRRRCSASADTLGTSTTTSCST